MSHPFPQYAKTSNAEVLAVHRENERQRKLFFEAARDLCEELTGRRFREWGAGYMGPGGVFEHDGAVYSRYTFTVTDDAPDGYDEAGWEEIKASEWHSAAEAHDESL